MTAARLLAGKLAAEAIATFMITGTAVSVDVLYYTGHHVDYASRWLARSLITSAVIYAFSELSGAHADPAITLAFALRRVFPWKRACAYVAAQFAGGLAASALLMPFYGTAFTFGISHPGSSFSAWEAAVCEVVLTFSMVLVILMTAQEESAVGKQAALAVGFVVAACGFAAGPISGASMNPARTVAPQLLAGEYATMWVYLAGPFAGAILAAGVHAMLCGPPSHEERKVAKGS